jgi:PAB1-binding protein PBP1
LLARILIAKVEDKARMERVLENVPIVQKDPSWRCRTSIINAVEALQKDGKALGTSKLDWDEIESTARKYVASKIDAGRYSERMDMAKPKPTWDMLEAKETAP